MVGKEIILNHITYFLWYTHDITFKTEGQVNDPDLTHRIPCKKQFFNVLDLDSSSGQKLHLSTFPVVQSDERLLEDGTLFMFIILTGNWSEVGDHSKIFRMS
jgi:hypothetical protein